MLSGFDAAQGSSISVVAALTVAIALVFGGLAWWARFRPWPAALTGLVFYVLVLAANFVANPGDAKGFAGTIAVLALLIWAVLAAARARNREPVSD
jgi:uncharacterized membrane protein (UPF0136 family)